MVAPHAGAWIETQLLPEHLLCLLVAPHAGAWIETLLTTRTREDMECRAPRGRVD